jgi:hypothetical protein
MKTILAALALLSVNGYAADKVGDIKSLNVSFQDLADDTTRVTISGTVVGLNCQTALTQPVLKLVEEDVDMFVYGVEFEAKSFLGLSRFVCVDLSTTVRPFTQTLELNTSYDLYFSYLKGVESLEFDNSGLPSSLQAIKDAAVCKTPTIPALETGFFGPGPVLPEICTYSIESKDSVSVKN